jgi:acetyl-CoA synthetase
MVTLLNKFVPKIEFSSYHDFEKNFKIEIPEKFNFAYDVVDEYAKLDPKKLQWFGVMIIEKEFSHSKK